jgi:hypothetical protein
MTEQAFVPVAESVDPFPVVWSRWATLAVARRAAVGVDEMYWFDGIALRLEDGGGSWGRALAAAPDRGVIFGWDRGKSSDFLDPHGEGAPDWVRAVLATPHLWWQERPASPAIGFLCWYEDGRWYRRQYSPPAPATAGADGFVDAVGDVLQDAGTLKGLLAIRYAVPIAKASRLDFDLGDYLDSIQEIRSEADDTGWRLEEESSDSRDLSRLRSAAQMLVDAGAARRLTADLLARFLAGVVDPDIEGGLGLAHRLAIA